MTGLRGTHSFESHPKLSITAFYLFPGDLSRMALPLAVADLGARTRDSPQR